MKNECSIVKDLLPLYVDGILSVDTESFVKGHLKCCKECAAAYQKMKEPDKISQSTQLDRDAAPLIKLKRKIVAKRVGSALLALIFAVTVLISLFTVFSAPNFYSYSDNLLSAVKNDDGSVTVTFDESVTNYRYEKFVYEDKNTERYSVEAWTCPWDKWFSDRGIQSFTIRPNGDRNTVVYYLQNNGMEDVLVYGQETDTSLGGTVTLPRLVLGHYLVIMAIVFLCLFVEVIVLKKNRRIRMWLERMILFPISYAIGHLVVMGFDTVSYSAERDLILILALSALLYCGLLLVHGMFYLRKEMKQDEGADM